MPTYWQNSLVRIGEYVADNGMEGDGPYLAARDLLMRMPPRIGGQPIQIEGETTLAAALRIAPAIAGGVFPIQGPPGAGKTHTGAAMVCALVAAGKTVGVTANSHKVIRNLPRRGPEGGGRDGHRCSVHSKSLQKSKLTSPACASPRPTAALLNAIGNGSNVAGGTAWLWASPGCCECGRRPVHRRGRPDVARECSGGITGGAQRCTDWRPAAARTADAR